LECGGTFTPTAAAHPKLPTPLNAQREAPTQILASPKTRRHSEESPLRRRISSMLPPRDPNDEREIALATETSPAGAAQSSPARKGWVTQRQRPPERRSCGKPLAPHPQSLADYKNNRRILPCVLEPTVYQRVIMHRHSVPPGQSPARRKPVRASHSTYRALPGPSALDPHFLIAPYAIRNRRNPLKTKDRHVF
jgi:hypothetical protein